jgi:hypothetical protein
MMRVLYPQHPLNKTQADEPYHEEFTVISNSECQCSLFDYDALAFDRFNPHPKIQPDERVLYRGWMLDSSRYKTLITQIEREGGIPITSHDDYLRCHYLPGWYQQCSNFTAETYFFAVDKDLELKLAELGWERYFVKDFVKSNTAKLGSIANSPSEVRDIIEQIATYRGEIEGGIAIRRVENYRSDTERRYFIVNGIPYSSNEAIPTLVKDIAGIIDAPFYSVDVVENLAGELRLVELGDGQVSDKKNWSISKMVEVVMANA